MHEIQSGGAVVTWAIHLGVRQGRARPHLLQATCDCGMAFLSVPVSEAVARSRARAEQRVLLHHDRHVTSKDHAPGRAPAQAVLEVEELPWQSRAMPVEGERVTAWGLRVNHFRATVREQRGRYLYRAVRITTEPVVSTVMAEGAADTWHEAAVLAVRACRDAWTTAPNVA